MSRTEYIEREAAIKELINDAPEQVGYSREDAADCIRYMDAADVAQVVHGEWAWFEEWSPSTPDALAECENAGWECSRCKIDLAEYLSNALGETVYCDNPDIPPAIARCPNCGAMMDGGAG